MSRIAPASGPQITDPLYSRIIDNDLVVELNIPPQAILALNQNDGMTYRTEGA